MPVVLWADGGPMICHVCKQQAVGQCKSCGKFYCGQHGDVYCTPCRTAIQPAEQAIERKVKSGATGGPELATPRQIAGPLCYACRSSANRACSKCGVFFCPQHGGLYASRQSWSVPLCEPCAKTERGWLTCMWIYAAVCVIFVIAMIISFAGR